MVVWDYNDYFVNIVIFYFLNYGLVIFIISIVRFSFGTHLDGNKNF